MMMMIRQGYRNTWVVLRGAALATAIASVAVSTHVTSGENERSAADRQALIEEALSAAPPQVAATATVIDLEGNVLREGSGEYTCLPGPQGFAGPMCHDEQFMGWMHALMNGDPSPPASAVGTAYMLAGDSLGGGASNVDPAALTPTLDNEWVVEGPHVMLIVPDPALLEGFPTSTEANGPYVMWPDSPYAHLMWPVAERHEQRIPAEQPTAGALSDR